MKHTSNIRFVSFILCGLLFAATALPLIGCKDINPDVGIGTIDASTESAAPTVVGEGQIVFDFSITDGAGTTVYYEIHTDKTTVGEALTELEMLAGDPGPYGLYVKTVGGITVDYNKDGAYWAFYENGKYATAGVDQTDIVVGTDYAFKVEKG